MGVGWYGGWLLGALPVAAVSPDGPVLRHTRAWVVETPDGSAARLDPSGLARWRGQLILVSDKAHFSHVYAVVPADGRTVQPRSVGTLDAPGAGSDREGLAVCGDTLWVVVEQDSQLVQVSPVGVTAVIDLDFSTVQSAVPPSLQWMNAGLEGVACAPDGRMWVAKEREPRAIFEVDPSTGAALAVWDERARTDQAVTIDGTTFWPSWADLQFSDGHLYALHRDGRRVVRLDPSTGRETAAVTLSYDEQLLYADAKPYGMAEGLLIEDDAIWVVLDNNAKTMNAGPRSGEPAPLLLRYDRPSGF